MAWRDARRALDKASSESNRESRLRSSGPSKRVFASVTAPLDKINERRGVEDVLQERHVGRIDKIPEEQRNACRNATLADPRKEPNRMEDRGRRIDGCRQP